MPWLGQKTDMSVVTGDLQLDAGAEEGSYLIDDIGGNPHVDIGTLGRYRINLQFDAKESGLADDTNEVKVLLEIDIATAAGPAWQGWRPYKPGEYYCRWYRLRATVKVDDAFGNRPKFLRFEHSHTPIGSVPVAASINDVIVTPTGTEALGTRYIVATGGTGVFLNKDEQIAELVDTTDRVWEFSLPVEGQKVYSISDAWVYEYEGGDYPAGTWIPRGFDVSNPEKDKYVGALTLVGAKDQLWNTDGGGDIGLVGGSRPDEIHAKTRITINGVDVVAGGGATYYQILDSTATASDINTALADAATFVVFLKPGSYALGANNISVPAQKALVGLGGVYQGTGAGADLTITVNATQRVQMGHSSRLQNLKLRFSSTSTAGNEMIETITNDGVVIRGVNVDGSAVGAGVGIVSWAILGAVKEVTHCLFYRCGGISVNATTQDEGGKSEIGWIHWTAHTTDTSVNMVGVSISSGPAWVHDIHGENGYGTLYVTVTDIMAERIWCESNDIYGIYWSAAGTEGILSDVVVDGGNYGCRLSAPRMTVSNFYARDTINRGFWSENQTDSTFESIHTYNCGGTTNAGVYSTGASRSTITNVTSYSGGSYGVHLRLLQQGTVSAVTANNGGNTGTGHHGIFVESCVRSTFSALTAYDNNFGSGVYHSGCTDCNFPGISAYGNGQRGVHVAASDGNTFGTVTVNSNSVDGIYVDGSSDYNTFGTVTSRANTGDGIEVAAGGNGNLFGNVLTQGNGGWGFLGGNAGLTANQTLHGHVSHADTSGARSLGTGWNSADVW